MINQNNYYEWIGKKVEKKGLSKNKGNNARPFKSGLKQNTVKAVEPHPYRNTLAFTFLEDDSYVACYACSLVETISNNQTNAIMALEIEDKYILSQLPEEAPHHLLIIVQCYTGDGYRWRSTVDVFNRTTRYDRTKKTELEMGVNEEEILDVGYREFYQAMKKAKKVIQKTRYVWESEHDKGIKFEVDSFALRQDQLILLEIEKNSKEEQPTIPPFIAEHITEEVTGNTYYNNHYMALELA